MMTKRRFLAGLMAAVLLATGIASAQDGQPLTGAFDPEDVLANLEELVKTRDWRRYGDFLAEEFRFVPFASVYVEYPEIKWDMWGRSREIRFIQELVHPTHSPGLALRDSVINRGIESRGRAEWDLVYSLDARGGRFKSRAIFVFEKVDNLWYLLEWTDTTIESVGKDNHEFPTSGSLRGILSH